ncbi:MAG: tRNA (guanosine(46)-N7)-methyltransferase TrmB [Gammaproteobacteria bacterium]|nr:tRNA (guanosine(46)-N7)-methyltransferase TrmB [Gammaproteobacteria bacterium]
MKSALPGNPHRKVRSYVQREGRMTPAQRRALETLWPKFGIDPGMEPLDLDALFRRHVPRIMEIGFGDGECLVELARLHPERDYLGVEVHRPGVGHLLLALEKDAIENVRIVCADAVEVLEQRIPDSALTGVNIYFPDPWPKKRHHKRRLIQPVFVDLLARKLAAGGNLHLATDWRDYAEQMLELLSANPDFQEVGGPAGRPGTKFEARGRRLGHGVWDLVFTRSLKRGSS